MTNNTNNLNTKILVGPAYFAKILGNPVPNFNKDGFEWTLDLGLSKEAVSELKSVGLGPKIKEGNESHNGIPYITFRRSSVKKAGPRKGEENKPIRVVGPDGQTPWDHDTLIGNNSTIAVKFSINEVTSPQGKKSKRADILSVQVRNLVPYEGPGSSGAEFEAVDPDAQTERAVNSDW